MLEKFFCRYLGHSYEPHRPNVAAIYYACRRCGKIRNQREYDACVYEAEMWMRYAQVTGRSLNSLEFDQKYRELVTDAVNYFLSFDGDPT